MSLGMGLVLWMWSQVYSIISSRCCHAHLNLSMPKYIQNKDSAITQERAPLWIYFLYEIWDWQKQEMCSFVSSESGQECLSMPDKMTNIDSA